MTTVEPAAPAVVQLAAILDLNAAGPLAHELGAARGRDVSLDASAVSRLGAQCLQVLVAARTAWRSDGYGFRVVSPSDEFTAGVALLGAPLDPWFNPVEPSQQ
jgi:chemotaxis protein CheX